MNLTVTERTRLQEEWLCMWIKHLNYKVIETMTTVIDNLLVCITIEICKERKKNVIISCVYRSPGSSVEAFKNCFQKLIKMLFSFVVISMLLNPNKQKMTYEFINTMHSMSLYPKITRPSRITPHCATLIDNMTLKILQ